MYCRLNQQWQKLQARAFAKAGGWGCRGVLGGVSSHRTSAHADLFFFYFP